MTATPSRIVKRHTVPPQGLPVAFNFEDVRKRCDDYREQIREQCRRMMLDAVAEADTLKQQAAVEGRSDGYRHGLRQAEEEIERRSRELAEQLAAERLAGALPALTQLIDELNSARGRFLAEWETELVGLAVAIAGRIVHREFAAQPRLLEGTIRDTLRLAVGRRSIELRLSPRDLETLGDSLSKAVQSGARGMEVRVVEDESVAPGGCVVVSEHGEIDAQLDTLLERITDELLDGLRDEHRGP